MRKTISNLPFNLSPKVLADLIVSAVGFVLTYFAIDLDPEVAAAIAKVAGTIAAYFTPPAQTVSPEAEIRDLHDVDGA